MPAHAAGETACALHAPSLRHHGRLCPNALLALNMTRNAPSLWFCCSTLAGGEVLQCVQRAGAAVQLPSGDRLARAVAADAARFAGAGVQLEALYEDEHMACVIKPQGIPCDTPSGRSGGSSTNGSEGGSASASRSSSFAALSEAGSGAAALPCVFTLLAHALQPSQQVGALRRPRHVHRLDEPTGGLLLAAKTRAAQQALCTAFEQRQVRQAAVKACIQISGALCWCLPACLLCWHRRLLLPSSVLANCGCLICKHLWSTQPSAVPAAPAEHLPWPPRLHRPPPQVHKRYQALVWGRLEGRGLVTYELDSRRCETEYAAVQHTAVDLSRLSLGDPAAVEAAIAAAAAAADGSAAAAAVAVAGAGGNGAAAAAAAARSHGFCSSDASPSSTALWVTTVDLWPHTGRKHQLRRHMALLGHPLVGDPRYSFGYAQQRLQSGQTMALEDHLRLPADAAPDAAAAGAARSAAAMAAAVPQPVPDALGPERALLRLAVTAAEQQHSFKLCLWALELCLESHPATGQPLHLQMPEPPLFAEVRSALAGGMA